MLQLAVRLCLLLLAVAASSLAAEVVRFSNGHLLRVDSYALAGNKVELYVGGGVLTVPLTNIAAIDDKIFASRPEPRRGRRPLTVLDFRRGQPVPDTPFGEMIYRKARQFGLNPGLLAAIAQVRSGFDHQAVAESGEVGLLQLLPSKAQGFGVAPEDLVDPERNLEAGARYLNFLRAQFADDLALVLASFDTNVGKVRLYQGVPPEPATQEFVERVRAIFAPRATTEP